MATYWVATDGNDEAAGSFAAPVLTINHGIDLASSAGDVLYVRSGTYNERVTIDNSGSAESGYITIAKWWADATRPVCRGFTIANKSYIRIVDIEVTHTTTDYSAAFNISGTCDHIQVLRCYSHNVYSGGGSGMGQVHWISTGVTNVAVRDCEFSYGGCPPVDGQRAGNSAGVAGAGGSGHLIEYNHVHHNGDFILLFAAESIVRNNRMEDFDFSYFPDMETVIGSLIHPDFFQPCGIGPTYPTNWCIYEANYGTDNSEEQSHAIIQQAETTDDHHMIYRGNVFTDLGEGAAEITGAHYTAYLCNTHYLLCQQVPAGNDMWYNHRAWNPTNARNFNNLFSHGGSGGIVVEPEYVDPVFKNNWFHETGTHASSVGTADPKFVNAASDWHLQSDSPVIDQGCAISAVATADGSGTAFDVTAGDGWLFCDGYGIAEGDLIAVGAGDPVRITDVTTDTITVASSISWTQGDGVYWRTKQALDIGAYEYRATYAYDVTLSVASNGTITATPTVPALVRDVEFWIDGLPVARDYDSPYSYSWNLAGLSGQHYIEVRAHALYADEDLWQEADREVTVTDGAVVAGTGDLYEVTYDANGAASGSAPTDTTDYAASAEVTVLGNTGALARTGYYFRGWNTAADGSGTHYAPGATFEMPAENETLYAEWHTLFAWVKG